MAGIQLGSSFRLSSPVPHLANASFPDAPTRLAAGQLRHVSWHYSQENPDAHYRIFPLAVCFLSDGVTPATQFGTWGTLEAHWRIVPLTSDDLPESAAPTNKYYTSARAALKADLVNGLVPVNQLPPYPTLTGGTAYTLPQAAANTLGGLKLGANLTLNATSGQVDAAAAPLYGNTGTATDGPMTQASTTTALGLKTNATDFNTLSSTVAARSSPISIQLVSGGRIGYATLDAALALTASAGISMVLNTGGAAITVTNPITALPGRPSLWPNYFDAGGASITVSNGITVNLQQTLLESTVIHNAYFYAQNYGVASTAVLLFRTQNSASPLVGPNRAAQFSDTYSEIPIQLNFGELTLNNGSFVSILGQGTVYLFGSVVVGSIGVGITVVDKRTAVPATATTAGVVKIGSGVAVAADGTISVAAAAGGTAYTLLQASPTVLGGIKLGSNLGLNPTTGLVDANATFLNLIGQPSDNANLAATLAGRLNNRGAWASSTIYQPNDVVSFLGSTYYNAGVAFTSGAAFLASNWTAFFASGIKADLVTGVVPYVQLPTGMLMLKQQSGAFSYYNTYETAIGAAGAGDTIYFGPGTFGSASVNVHMEKTISLVLDPSTTWLFNLLYLQTYPNTGDRLYVINGQGGGRLVGTIAFNDGSQVAALTLANLRHDGNITHSAYLVGTFTEIPVKIKFDQVRSFAATGDYLSVLPHNGGFYYRALVIESYNSFHTVTAGSFINNLGSDGSTGAANASLVRMHRSTIRCAATAPLIVNADTIFVYDLSLVGYVGTLSAGIVNGTNYFFAGGATPDSLSPMTWAASVVVDFNLETVRTMLANGNVAYGPSLNIAPLRTKEHYITNNTGAAITLSFPTTWTFFPGPAPTSLAAGKQAVLTLRSLGSTDATIKAAYVAQA